MNPKWRVILRKLIYVVLAIPLIAVMYPISNPSTIRQEGDETGKTGSAGGKLARMRAEQGLTQASLGEVDPASETVRLASLGLSNVAVSQLWLRADELKKRENWDGLANVLDQIAKFQPNFESVWRFQAWNMSYNVSAEFDDYKDRYYWVKKGIRYLYRGMSFNRDSIRLIWDTGWFVSHKIGRSDERKQFRRMFRNDVDFHGELAERENFDNWLEGKKWFEKAQQKYLSGVSLKGMSPLTFNVDVAMAQINYSDNQNEDGVFGQASRQNWELAAAELYEPNSPLLNGRQSFGEMEIPSSYGFSVRMNDLEPFMSEHSKLREELYALSPQGVTQLTEEARSKLTAQEREMLDTPADQRKQELYYVYDQLENKMRLEPKLLAEKIAAIEPSKAFDARRLGARLAWLDERISAIGGYRAIVNYDFWRARCRMERTEDADNAHRLVYEGGRKMENADTIGAQKDYEEGILLWKKVLDEHASLIDDRRTGDEILGMIRQYRRILDQNEQPFPKPFPLQMIIDKHDVDQEFR